MKKITCLLFVSFLFFNCSKPDEPTDNANNPVNTKSSISFTMNNAEYEQDYTLFSNITNEINDVTWEKSDITTTSANEFTIDASPKVKGKACDFLELFTLTIRTTDKVLVANKTYNLYTNDIYYFLPLNDPALCYKEVGLWDSSKTSGTVKITSFDGKILKGEFNISNLTNKMDGFSLGYCNGTPIVEKIFNITNGTFTAIPY